MNSYHNMNIFITGGTHGIGKATAKLFCEKGFNVFITGSNPNDENGYKMQETFRSLKYFLADVTDETAMSSVLDTIGHIDLAFNNAGIGIAPTIMHNCSVEDFRRVVDVNLTGTIISMKYEIKKMLESGVGGVIINNSSIAALKSGSGADFSYAASKSAVLTITREASDIYKNTDIKFCAIVPHNIKTRMTAVNHCVKYTEPEAVAELIFDIFVNRNTVNSESNNTYYIGGE